MSEILTVKEYTDKIIIDNHKHMSRTDLAKALGITRKALWVKMKNLGIKKECVFDATRTCKTRYYLKHNIK